MITAMIESERTTPDERLRDHIRSWNHTMGDTVIERHLSEDGRITYCCVIDGTLLAERSPMEVPSPSVYDEELNAWRVGTTGLSPVDADRLWRWYNDVYETALINDNRTRGVRVFFERGALFPWRTATCGRHRYDRARSALPSEWAEWVIDVGITHTDVNRNDLLVGQQGLADVPRPTSRCDEPGSQNR